VAEGFSLEAEALALIVRESGGSVRDGLSLLEQMFSYGEKEIRATEVTEVLGLVSRQLLLQITTALLENDRTAALTCLEDIFDYGMDLRRFIEDLLNHFRTLLFCRIKGCSELVDATAEELAEFKKIAAEHSGETIHLKLSLLMELAERLRFSSQPRLLLETSFVKIIEAGNVVSITTLLGKLDKLLPDEPLAAEQNDQDRAKDPLPPPAAPATMRPQPEKDNNQDQPAQPSPSSLVKKTGPNQHPAAEPSSAQPSSRPEVVEDGQGQPGSKKTEPQATQPQNPLNEPSVQIKSHKKNIRSHWLEFIDYVKARKPWMSTDLQRADRAGEKVEGELHLHFADPANCALMRRKENRQLLTEFALDFFQKPLKIVFVLPEATESPENDEDDLPQKKRQQLANDPLVLMATEIFNGQVGDIRIGPQQN
jgi:DNA polymerase-3 subunit gamma/tau